MKCSRWLLLMATAITCSSGRATQAGSSLICGENTPDAVRFNPAATSLTVNWSRRKQFDIPCEPNGALYVCVRPAAGFVRLPERYWVDSASLIINVERCDGRTIDCLNGFTAWEPSIVLTCRPSR